MVDMSLKHYEKVMDGTPGCWARYRAEILHGSGMDRESQCAYMEGFIGSLLRSALVERDKIKKDLESLKLSLIISSEDESQPKQKPCV
jgi:hypothetical protein